MHSFVTLLSERFTERWMRASSRRAGYTHHKFPRIGSDKRGDKVVAKRAGAEAVEILRINLDRTDAGYYGGLWHFLHNLLWGIEQYAVKITNAGDLSWWGECVWACACLWFMSTLRRSQRFLPTGACGLVPDVINTVFFICIERSYASEPVFVRQINSFNSNYYFCWRTEDQPCQPDVPAGSLSVSHWQGCTHERRVHYKSCSCNENEMEITISGQKV